MKINWQALGSTFGFSMLVTVGVVAVFCLGVSALSRREAAVAGDGGSRGSGVPALAAASACFAACAAVVGYGLYLIALA